MGARYLRAHGCRTPAEIDRSLPLSDDRACRARFHADARAALARVALLQLTPNARCRAAREAILCTMRVRRTKGAGHSLLA
jgi:hypothetical protein